MNLSEEPVSYIHGRKSGKLVLLVMILIVVTLVFLVFALNFYRESRDLKSCLVIDAMITEGRHRQIDNFFKLEGWFQIFVKSQSLYYLRNHRYAKLSEFDSVMMRAIDPAGIYKTIRTEFWSNSIYLDSFVPYDTLKNVFVREFGKNFINLPGGLDSALFEFDLKLADDKQSYSLVIREKMDVTFDNDSMDYFVYNTQFKDIILRFKDRDNKKSRDEILNLLSLEMNSRLVQQNVL